MAPCPPLRQFLQRPLPLKIHQQRFLWVLQPHLGLGSRWDLPKRPRMMGSFRRGSPLKRGIAAGVMTTLGGLGHALPYLINDIQTANIVAFVVVFFELWAIAFIQNKYMETPFLRATLQVVIGGALVFATGIWIGSS